MTEKKIENGEIFFTSNINRLTIFAFMAMYWCALIYAISWHAWASNEAIKTEAINLVTPMCLLAYGILLAAYAGIKNKFKKTSKTYELPGQCFVHFTSIFFLFIFFGSTTKAFGIQRLPNQLIFLLLIIHGVYWGDKTIPWKKMMPGGE